MRCFAMLVMTVGCLSAAPQPMLQDLLRDAELAGHVARIVRAVQAEGYDIATIHGTSLLSGIDSDLTRRDVEDHASHPSTESRNFELRLTSGEPLRMSLQKRSAMSPDVRVVERVSGREEIRRPQIRDCFFSGGLQGEEGHASLSLCDGQVMGAVNARKRGFELHSLPESAATRRRSTNEPLRMLVTWSEREERETDDFVPVIPDETDIVFDNQEGGKRSVADKSATIEVGVYLDRIYVTRVQEKMGLSTTQNLTDLITLKWSGIQAVLSNASLVGWTIIIKVVQLEIWWESPSWYNETKDHIGERMDMICKNTMDKPFDHILVETADTVPGRIMGISWLSTMCNSRWRCSAAKGVNFNSVTEIHETGHSMGLRHDKDTAECNPEQPKGFMGTQETEFKECYAASLNNALSQKSCLFQENVDVTKYNSLNNTLPLFRGQLLGFDRQCKLVNGDGFQYFPSSSASLCSKLTCIKQSPVGELVDMSTFLGTPCGQEQMCFQGVCVPWVASLNKDYLRARVVNSVWETWSAFSSCDNSCGAAVRVSTRTCKATGPYLTPYCTGDAVKAQTCPSQPACPGESSELSELLKQRANAVCAKAKDSGANTLTGEGNVTSGSGIVNKCTVSCKLVSGIPTHRYLLPDGTPCWGEDTDRTYDSTVRGISWKCVQGRCMAFGCNGKTLGEEGGLENDRCGVCGGEGSTCAKK